MSSFPQTYFILQVIRNDCVSVFNHLHNFSYQLFIFIVHILVFSFMMLQTVIVLKSCLACFALIWQLSCHTTPQPFSEDRKNHLKKGLGLLLTCPWLVNFCKRTKSYPLPILKNLDFFILLGCG